MVAFGDIRYCTKDAWFQVKEAELGNMIKPLNRNNLLKNKITTMYSVLGNMI